MLRRDCICRLPKKRRKWRNSLWICNKCQQGWTLLHDYNYADDWWEWKLWKNENS
jgi:hypothetical protein